MCQFEVNRLLAAAASATAGRGGPKRAGAKVLAAERGDIGPSR
jgi:hypothetical protein